MKQAKIVSHFSFSDIFKPTVGHRDLNSRNVLVRQDLSCVIADLGFCTSAKGSNVILKGRVENAEQTSLTDVSLKLIIQLLGINQIGPRAAKMRF